LKPPRPYDIPAVNLDREELDNEFKPFLNVELTTDGNIPLYFQLVGIIKRYVSAGILAPGDMLPSESELCKGLNISRSTVRRPSGAWRKKVLVIRKQGRGTFVAEPKMRRRNENVYSFTSEVTAWA
jgi:GntR family transcriptional regulator